MIFKKTKTTIVASAMALWLHAGTAIAADPTGEWLFDTEAFKTMMRAAMAAEMQDMPQNTKDQMAAMMEGMLNQMADKIGGTAIFHADGTATFNLNDGTTETGTWEDLGDQVKITPDTADEPGFGVINGDTMVVSIEDAEMPTPMELTWHRQ